MRAALIFLAFLALRGPLPGQDGLAPQLQFIPLYKQAALQLQEADAAMDSGNVIFETLRFYISGVTLLQDENVVWEEAESYHLLDAAVPTSLRFPLHLPASLTFNSLQFKLGIDSLTNVSGALGGDLDPTKGMYWAWNSGYINFKLEGYSPLCPTRKNAFQFHLGGYLPPFASWQTIRLPVSQTSPLRVYLDLDQFLAGLDLRTEHTVMSPGAAGRQLSQDLASLFHTDAAE